MFIYTPLWEDKFNLKPKWYQFTYITRKFLEDLGEPIFETNGWEWVYDYNTASRIYGPPGVIQLWNWWRFKIYYWYRIKEWFQDNYEINYLFK